MHLKKVLGIVLLILLILVLIFYSYYRNRNIDNIIINKHRIIVVKEDEVVNYETIEDHSIKNNIVNKDKFNGLKDYMKENNFKIKSGTYEINDADTLKKIIKTISFEKDN